MQSRQSNLNQINSKLHKLKESLKKIKKELKTTNNINLEALQDQLGNLNHDHYGINDVINRELPEIQKNRHELDGRSNDILDSILIEHSKNYFHIADIRESLRSIEQEYQQDLIAHSSPEETCEGEEEKDTPPYPNLGEGEGDGFFTLKTTLQTRLQKEFDRLDDELYSLEIKIGSIDRALVNLTSRKKLDNTSIIEGLSGRYKEYAIQFIEEWKEEYKRNIAIVPRNFLIKKLNEVKKAIPAMQIILLHKKEAGAISEEGYKSLDRYLEGIVKRTSGLNDLLEVIPKNAPQVSQQEFGLFNNNNSPKRKALGSDPKPSKKINLSRAIVLN
jgi:sugar-specific transcriptional regulator TrmB